jgi:hypothetical protein
MSAHTSAMTRSRRNASFMLVVLLMLVLACPQPAKAFCGFYVSSTSDEALLNEATTVILMRDGTRTVLSMQNNYRGPARDFAMVVPVPVVLAEGDVQVLDEGVFDRIDFLVYGDPDKSADKFARAKEILGEISISGCASSW